MEKFWLPLLAIFSIILQTTLIPELEFFGATPDLLLVIVIFAALQRQTTIDLVIIFILGLCKDVAVGNPLGLHAFILLVIAYLATRIRNKIFKDNFSSQIFMVMIFTYIYQFLIWFMLNTILETKFELGIWFKKSLGMSWYNVGIAIMLFKFLGKYIKGDDVYRHLIKQVENKQSKITRIG